MELRASIYEHTIKKSWNLHEQVGNGAFASKAMLVDPSRKKIEIRRFNFMNDAPPIANNWVSPLYRLPERMDMGGNLKQMHELYDTRFHVTYQNSKAFSTMDPEFIEDTTNTYNLSGDNEHCPIDRNIMNSYMSRMDITVVNVYMDSFTTIRAGDTVLAKFLRFSPKLNEHGEEDDKDYINSGKYLISAVRHYIKNNEYTISMELIRDGMGEEAEFPEQQEWTNNIEPVVIIS
jgi:hypothetical protein